MNGYKKDNGSFKVIVTPKKGESELEAITNGQYKIRPTDDFLYSQEGDNSEKISKLSRLAKIKSAIDPYNNYIVGVSREEGLSIIEVPKPKSWEKNISNDFHEAVGNLAKSNKKVAENWKNGKYLSAAGNGVISILNVPNLIQTGAGSTTADLIYSFNPGEVQYGKKKDILGRREANKAKAKGTTDLFINITATSVMPNKIGGGTITAPKTAQAVVATGEAVGVAGKVITLPALGTGGAKAMLIASGVGSSSKDSEKVDDNKNLEKEKTPKNRNLEEAASEVQKTSERIKIALKKDKAIVEVTRDGRKMYYDIKSKCYFYVDKTHSYIHYEVFDRTGKHIGVLDGKELEKLLENGGKITSIIDETGAVSGRRIKVK